MPNPYGEIFKAPGAKRFSAAGFVARMPLSMTTIGIVTMLSQTHGEYWLAGAVSATFALANAALAPQISRLVDRHGQSRVLVPATIIAVAGLVALMLATRYRLPAPILFLTAAVAGVMPSMVAMVRARWVALYRDTPQLRTAFAFESVVDEVIFILGPITAIGLSVAVFPEAGPLAATVLLTVGTALFAVQKATEPPVHPPRAAGGRAVIGLGAVQTVALAFAAMGSIFGTAEVTAVAFAEAHGEKAAASLVLAAYAAGSMIAGLVFGTLTITLPLARQFFAAIMLAAAMTWPLLMVDSIPMLALVLFLNGASIAPMVIIMMGLIERLVPASQLTEGMTWGMTGVGIGLAIGSSVSGWVIDNFGAANGFWVSVASGMAALAVAVIGYRTLNVPAAAADHPVTTPGSSAHAAGDAVHRCSG